MAGRVGWLMVGVLIVFGFLAAASIGLPFLLLGLVLAAVLTYRGARTEFGPLLGGASLVLISLGILNLGLTLGAVLLGLGVAAFAGGRVLCHRQTA